jgi:hypothetical protein
MKRSIFTTVFALGFTFCLGGTVFGQGDGTVPPASKPDVQASPSPAIAAPVQGGGIFEFVEETHDFGELMQGGDASVTFKFKNVGTEAIVITDARKSCGCTTPKNWTKDPIPPGGEGYVDVAYDSNRIGGFDKSVTLISNASGGDKVLKIKGNILPKPAAPDYTAPAVTPATPVAPAGGH